MHPKHIAIIMDGNGRWAQERHLPRIEGHRRGVKTFKNVLKWAKSRGVGYLTCYAFSKENWNRPFSEVRFLMQLLAFFAQKERVELINEGVRILAIGNLSQLPKKARRELEYTMDATKKNDEIVVQLALSYSGRDEVLKAAKKLAESYKEGFVSDLDAFSERDFEGLLDTKALPHPDLVIRTSGEMRTSNFLIWQAAYSEFYFSPKLWPDFDEEEFDQAIASFEKRDRRFGQLKSVSGRGQKA